MTDFSKISAVDLFCGVGGLTHGLSLAKIDVRLGVDIDPASRHPFEKNNDAKFLQADVSALSAETISQSFVPGTVSLLAGCAPCQPFSTYSQKAKRAGQGRVDRGGKDDWKLVERFGELIREVQPDLVTMENVPPLLRAPVYQELLASLKGYSVDAQVVECRMIGLPQTRKRLVLIASKLGEINLPQFDRKQKSVREEIGNLPRLEAGQTDPKDRLHRASTLSEMNMKRILASVPGGTWRDWPDSLKAACHVRDSGATYPSVYGRMAWDEPSPTITTQCFGYGNGRFGHPEQNRAISLREAAMLQGFPRGYSFLPDDERVSFATLGRLIGNAVPVTLGKVIGEILVEHVNAQIH
ncbi:site-specific DNA-methyltransferase [Novosphingobium sp. Rr 2-17]|uniref:DNA cytosine methyltransferase n=1 Tax=Novosphingobium sp. Rr 2-17 TaxID=555793 RepID=UPI00026988ED|nr:DNA cytosine methyltransferase [Novosphingobium sp. Rr 2-17]EIZ77786.1 site-specific DNA-methyltransferase [Novosphingobium sp. Rr 2-17]